MLRGLSDVNRRMNLLKEGIQQAEEALEIFKRLGHTEKQVDCLITLAYALSANEQLDAAREVASRAVDLLPETGQQSLVCQAHQVLGHIHRSKGNTEKALHHLEVALGIASPPGWHGLLFWIHLSLAQLFSEQG